MRLKDGFQSQNLPITWLALADGKMKEKTGNKSSFQQMFEGRKNDQRAGRFVFHDLPAFITEEEEEEEEL